MRNIPIGIVHIVIIEKDKMNNYTEYHRVSIKGKGGFFNGRIGQTNNEYDADGGDTIRPVFDCR